MVERYDLDKETADAIMAVINHCKATGKSVPPIESFFGLPPSIIEEYIQLPDSDTELFIGYTGQEPAASLGSRANMRTVEAIVGRKLEEPYKKTLMSCLK